MKTVHCSKTNIRLNKIEIEKRILGTSFNTSLSTWKGEGAMFTFHHTNDLLAVAFNI